MRNPRYTELLTGRARPPSLNDSIQNKGRRLNDVLNLIHLKIMENSLSRLTSVSDESKILHNMQFTSIAGTNAKARNCL